MKICPSCNMSYNGQGWKCPGCGNIPERISGFLTFLPRHTERDKGGFDIRYFEGLAQVEADHFWFRSRKRLILWGLQRYFSGVDKLLELGCGTGLVLSDIEKAFPNTATFGSDIYVAGISFAAARLKKTQLFQMDAHRIPFRDEFDVVGAFDLLEHTDDEVVLSQMFKAVRQGGGIIVTVPQHSFLWSQYDVSVRHYRRYSREELSSKVTDAGFKVEDIISFTSFLFPVIVLSRLKVRCRRGELDAMDEIRVRWVAVNRILEKIFDFERHLIRRGMRLPFGGSLLLVARKTS